MASTDNYFHALFIYISSEEIPPVDSAWPVDITAGTPSKSDRKRSKVISCYLTTSKVNEKQNRENSIVPGKHVFTIVLEYISLLYP